MISLFFHYANIGGFEGFCPLGYLIKKEYIEVSTPLPLSLSPPLPLPPSPSFPSPLPLPPCPPPSSLFSSF